ncbi:MAG: hypothetical protein ACTHJT_06115 [Cytophaga sp.]
MKKILYILSVSVTLIVLSGCSSSKAGQYGGKMTRKRPCPQGCD